MRNVLVFALLIGAGFAVAGFFAHGMARLSGIAPASTGGPRVDTRKPVEALKASKHMATENAATEHVAAAAIESASTENAPHTPTPDTLSTHNVPLPSEVIESSPVISETQTVAAKRVAAPVAPARPAISIPPKSNPPKSLPPKTALVIPPSLSTAEAREAQCRSLSAYLSELETIARTRTEPGVQVWIQNQRTTTWERQTELRC